MTDTTMPAKEPVEPVEPPEGPELPTIAELIEAGFTGHVLGRDGGACIEPMHPGMPGYDESKIRLDF